MAAARGRGWTPGRPPSARAWRWRRRRSRRASGSRSRPACASWARRARPMELLRLADGALYWAKAHGRNRLRPLLPRRGRGALRRGARRPPRARSRPSMPSWRWPAPWTRRIRTRCSTRERVAEMAARVALEMGWSADRVRPAARGGGAARRRQDRGARPGAHQAGAAHRRRSSRSSASTRCGGPRSWPRRSCPSRWRGCAATTSASTAPATRTASPATTSPTAPGSWRSPTPGTP